MTEVTIDGYPVKMYWFNGKRIGGNYRLLKLYLLKEYKVCYFCGIEVKDYPQVNGEHYKDDLATIDHLKPRQYRKRNEITEKVLACYGCNSKRNDQEQRRS